MSPKLHLEMLRFWKNWRWTRRPRVSSDRRETRAVRRQTSANFLEAWMKPFKRPARGQSASIDGLVRLKQIRENRQSRCERYASVGGSRADRVRLAIARMTRYRISEINWGILRRAGE